MIVDHCLELLAPLGAVRARRMFGGWGLYVDDVFLAIVDGDNLYLKVDAETEPRFRAAGCTAFVVAGKAGPVSMSYWTAPPEAMESPALMGPWARLALEAALRAAVLKRRPRTSGPAAGAGASAATPPRRPTRR